MESIMLDPLKKLDPLRGKYLVFAESVMGKRRAKIEGIVGASHCLVRFDAETPALRLVKLERLAENMCSIFDSPQEAGFQFPADEGEMVEMGVYRDA
jgi:hypothetical protein